MGMGVRVLAMVHAYPPAHNAGAEMTIHTMLRHMVKHGHEVHVQLSRPRGDIVDRLNGAPPNADYELDGVQVHLHRSVDDPHRYFVGQPRADIVIAHLENTPRAAALCDMHKVPMVHLLHNHHAFTMGALRRGPVQLAVFNTHWMRQAYADYWAGAVGGPLPPHEVIHPPVDLRDYSRKPGSHIALINLNEDKGGHLFWELARRVRRPFLGIQGAYGDQIIPEDMPDNAVVIPHQPPDRMAALYSDIKILLMPSGYESYGRTAIEAASCGIPTIAHPTPGLVEALGEGGTFVDRSDVDGWVAAISRLSTPKGWAKASREARAVADALDTEGDLDRFVAAMERTVRRGFATVTR